MSRFHDWTKKARAVLSTATAIEREAPRLRELADELERQGLDEACTRLRAVVTLMGQTGEELRAELERVRLTPATREVEFWKAGGS